MISVKGCIACSCRGAPPHWFPRILSEDRVTILGEIIRHSRHCRTWAESAPARCGRAGAPSALAASAGIRERRRTPVLAEGENHFSAAPAHQHHTALQLRGVISPNLSRLRQKIHSSARHKETVNGNGLWTRIHSVGMNPGTRADCSGLLHWGVLTTHNPSKC